MPVLKTTPSCPQCLICGKQYHRLISHVRLTHNLSKEQYLDMFPDAKIHSDEYIKKHEETSRKIQESQQIFWTSEKAEITRQKLSDIQRDIQSNIPKEIKSEKAKKRNIELKQNTEKYNNFRNKCRVASRKYWDNVDEKTKQTNLIKWQTGWKKWYDSLSDEERIQIHQYCHTRTIVKTTINGIDYTFKSKLEVIVANYLVEHNIDFLYEKIVIDIEKFNNINNRKKYYPDFYIPKYNLIIESKGLFKKSKNDKIEDILSLLDIQREATLADERNFNFEYIWYNRKKESIINQLDVLFNKYGEDIVHNN